MPSALSIRLTAADFRELSKRPKPERDRVADAGLLHELDELLRQMVGAPTEADYAARAAGKRPLLLSIPEAKARLGDYLDSIDYRPAPGEEGTLKDLRSHARRKLIVETNLLDTLGYGQWAAFQNRDTLAQFPGQELVRLRFATRPRDWAQRWEAAREEVGYDGCTSAASGRMAALKNHPIWQALGEGEDAFAPDPGVYVPYSEIVTSRVTTLGLTLLDLNEFTYVELLLGGGGDPATGSFVPNKIDPSGFAPTLEGHPLRLSHASFDDTIYHFDGKFWPLIRWNATEAGAGSFNTSASMFHSQGGSGGPDSVCYYKNVLASSFFAGSSRGALPAQDRQSPLDQFACQLSQPLLTLLLPAAVLPDPYFNTTWGNGLTMEITTLYAMPS